jgi:hypothetical protein
MINTVWGSTDKPVSSKRLAELLSAKMCTFKVPYILAIQLLARLKAPFR